MVIVPVLGTINHLIPINFWVVLILCTQLDLKSAILMSVYLYFVAGVGLKTVKTDGCPHHCMAKS
jgi:hypothetical protein